MEKRNHNMKVDWDLEEGRLRIIFCYPSVNNRCIDENNNIWKSSSSVVRDAISEHFKGTKIRWTNGSSTSALDAQILTLEITNYDKDISFKKLNAILLKLNNQIKTELYYLINPKDVK